MPPEHDLISPSPQPEAVAAASEAAPPTEASSTTFSASGAIPGVGHPTGGRGHATASDQAFGYVSDTRGLDRSYTPEIAATDDAMGQHMVQGMEQANRGGSLTRGIHYWFNYKTLCTRAGKDDLWKDEYRHGHTQATQFIQPHERNAFMEFELKKGESASKGIKDWLAGATIAECLTAVLAMEIDTLRAAIGDHKFDSLYGSLDPAVDSNIQQRLRISTDSSSTPVGSYMAATAIAEKASAGGEFGAVSSAELEAELKPGQWYYFYNHPKYVLKHPGGAWQGENALYMGKNAAGERMWSGLGATATEDHMMDTMVRAYNSPRNDHDIRMLTEGGALGADGTYVEPEYDPASGAFPELVTREDILTAPPFTVGGTTRKGGFMATAGTALDAKAVQKTRSEW